ncbi:MAG: hypothetical protein U5K30_01560 [Acidimicrobiales bacterium]|nr:hypothetical protein [Acidimicrobiales bacterium]
MSVALIDDHLLLRLLLDEEPQDLRSPGTAIATTGLWYHRLCRALADEAVVGSMSRRLGAVENDVAASALASVIELPETVELVSLRTLGWPMAELVHAGARLNLLSLEALAAARRLSAEICLAEQNDNDPLRAAASALEVTVRSVTG